MNVSEGKKTTIHRFLVTAYFGTKETLRISGKGIIK
jgi:hypothetical protein